MVTSHCNLFEASRAARTFQERGQPCPRSFGCVSAALSPARFRCEAGALMIELMVAIALLVIAVLPIGYSIASERILARSYYERAVAMEIVDGEMEVLLAGEWRSFSPGTQDYSIHANAATNLPDGKFLLTIESGKVRLEWRPAEKHHGGSVVREAVVK